MGVEEKRDFGEVGDEAGKYSGVRAIKPDTPSSVKIPPGSNDAVMELNPGEVVRQIREDRKLPSVFTTVDDEEPTSPGIPDRVRDSFIQTPYVTQQDWSIWREVQDGNLENISELGTLAPAITNIIVSSWREPVLPLNSLVALDYNDARILAHWEGERIDLPALIDVTDHVLGILMESSAKCVAVDGVSIK